MKCKWCGNKIENPRPNKIFCCKKHTDSFHANKNYYLHRNEEEFMERRRKLNKKWIENNRKRFNEVMLRNYHKRKKNER